MSRAAAIQTRRYIVVCALLLGLVVPAWAQHCAQHAPAQATDDATGHQTCPQPLYAGPYAALAPALALSSSLNPQMAQNPITLSATLSSGAGSATGQVSFYDGTQLLGTVALGTSGTASYTAAALPAGTHSLTASYSGDASYSSALSNTLPQVMQDFALSTPVQLDNNTCQCHLPAGTSLYLFSVAATNGTALAGPVNLAITQLPAGYTATLSVNNLAVGSSVSPVSVTVQAPIMLAGLQMPWAALAALLSLPWLRTRQRRSVRNVLIVLAAAVAMVAVSACGGASPAPASSSTPGALQMTGTSGNLAHTASISLP
ncbi:MAG: Ig-like domain repeat protein [Acidobacteriota bacterium]|nr:Ig-like domain repeat protein [Acidobacteriota bacterium]